MPGLKVETYGSGDQSWLASNHGMRNAETVTLKLSTFTEAAHFPNGFIPSGTPVNVADPGAVVPFADAAGNELGFVLFDVPTDGVTDVAAPVIVHGIIHAERVPGDFAKPATAPAGGFVFVKGENN